nr:hypothetical protein [uncultured Pseudomonas sp.]
MYNHYKPLRNFVSNLKKVDSLTQIWSFFGSIDNDYPLPIIFSSLNNSGKPSLKGVVHPWELDILTREIILHSHEKDSKNLYNTNHLSIVINKIRSLSDVQIRTYLKENIFQELQRLYQQQAIWRTNTKLMLARYLKIYSTPSLEAILVKATGLSVMQFYVLGISIYGHFIKNHVYNTNQNYQYFGISNQQRDAFLEKVIIGFGELKERMISTQEYNENWSYTINPLISTPLISVDERNPNIVICPIPFYLMYRFSEGLFFDIAKIKGYEQAYGDAFEKYIHDVSILLNKNDEPASKIKISRPEKYTIGKIIKHGADLLLFDGTAAILLECKAKRLNLKARYQLNDEALCSEIDVLAKYVVQNYKNLQDVINGHTAGEIRHHPIFPVVVTLVNWHLFGPKVYERLEQSVIALLSEAKIDSDILDKHPYTVMSADEYELALQIIYQVGIEFFFKNRTKSQHKNWMTTPFINEFFPGELKLCRDDYLKFVLDDLQAQIATPISKKD